MTAINRTKVCALIAALQQEPTEVERLVVLSGMEEATVHKWLTHFEQARLAARAGHGERMPGRKGPAPTLWTWRFA